MHLSRILFAKVKSKHVLVKCESTVSGRRFNVFRERNADKAEFVHYDPHVGKDCVYREVQRIRSATFGPQFTPFTGYTNGGRKKYENEPDVYIPKLKNTLI